MEFLEFQKRVFMNKYIKYVDANDCIYVIALFIKKESKTRFIYIFRKRMILRFWKIIEKELVL